MCKFAINIGSIGADLCRVCEAWEYERLTACRGEEGRDWATGFVYLPLARSQSFVHKPPLIRAEGRLAAQTVRVRPVCGRAATVFPAFLLQITLSL